MLSSRKKPSWVFLAWQVICVACLGSAHAAQSREFRVTGFSLEVPVKFEGPSVTQPDSASTIYSFTAQQVGFLQPTILQITSIELGEDLRKKGDPEISGMLRQYLSQMLQGIESRREEYRDSPASHVRLAGAPGAKISWSGKTDGAYTNGMMFCGVTSTGLVFFHVVGSGKSPTTDMAAAIKAVESARRY
jgi:hypothetical protein